MRTLSWNLSFLPSKQRVLPGGPWLDPNVRETTVPEPTAPTVYTLEVYDAIGQRYTKQYIALPAR